MVGDSLVYAVIPAAAATYGLGAVGVSLVLSVNRFARLALNPLVARWLGRIGWRRGTIVGAALAVASTAGYAVAPGLTALLAARVVWGASFATLRLTMLGYATTDPRRSPRRLGIAVGVQELAPAAVLLTGAALLGVLGARWLFAALALVSALALPLALALPRTATTADHRRLATSPSPAPRAGNGGLRRASLATATVAFGVDGALSAGVVLTLLAFGSPPTEAAAVGAIVLAARKVAQVAVSPAAGLLAQRWGVNATVTVGMLGAAGGLAGVAAGAVVPGSLLAATSAAAVMALTPAAIVSDRSDERMRAMGWLATSRDLGGATGAAFAPLALIGAGAADVVAWTFGGTAAAVAVAALVWVVAARRDRGGG